MATEISLISDRLERSGAPPGLARAIAAELAELHDRVRGEVVTREHLEISLGKLRAEVERDIAQLGARTQQEIAELRTVTQRDIAALRIDMERLLREQTNKLVIWLGAIVGLAVTVVGGLGVLF